jgi:hypothetical protein
MALPSCFGGHVSQGHYRELVFETPCIEIECQTSLGQIECKRTGFVADAKHLLVRLNANLLGLLQMPNISWSD